MACCRMNACSWLVLSDATSECVAIAAAWRGRLLSNTILATAGGGTRGYHLASRWLWNSPAATHMEQAEAAGDGRREADDRAYPRSTDALRSEQTRLHYRVSGRPTGSVGAQAIHR